MKTIQLLFIDPKTMESKLLKYREGNVDDLIQSGRDIDEGLKSGKLIISAKAPSWEEDAMTFLNTLLVNQDQGFFREITKI